MDLTVPKVAATHTPALTDFKDYLESVTKEDALDSIKNLAQMESEDWFRIGMVLSSFQKTKGEEEFKSLLLYAEQNFQINPRKAYYLISIHDNLVGSHITPNQVSQIGWTKLKEIAHLLNSDNVDYWVEVCKSNTTKQIIALLKSNATTNVAKAKSIDDALDSTPAASTEAPVAPYEPLVVEGKSIPQTHTEYVANTDPTVDYVGDGDFTATGSMGAVTGTITDLEFTPHAKYTGTFVEPTEAAPLDVVAALDEAPDPDMVVAVTPVTAPIVSADQVAVSLKVYDLDIILKTVTEIFPHITIKVSEAEDATSSD